MENDLFQDKQTTTNIEDIDPNITTTTNYFEVLVGEGKKFKTPDDLARGKYESDQFIERLKSELKTLREQVNSSRKVEDLLNRLDTRNTQDDNRDLSVIDRNNQNQQNDTQERTPPPAFDIDKLIEQKLSQRDNQQVQQQNIQNGLKTLYESMGENYVALTKQRLNDLGMSGQKFREFMADNPKAALKLVLGNSPDRVQPNTPPASRVNNFDSQVSNKRDYNYYSNLRKTNPSLYNNDKTQMQMHNDAVAMGEAFYS